MSNAAVTVLVLSIPLLFLTVLPFGWLKSRKVYLTSGLILSAMSGTLIMAGLFASGMAAGHGGGDSGGWEGMRPMIIWAMVTIFLLCVGYSSRLKKP